MNGAIRRRGLMGGDDGIFIEHPTWIIIELDVPIDDYSYNFGYNAGYLLGTTVYVDGEKHTRSWWSPFQSVTLNKGKHTITSDSTSNLNKSESYNIDLTYATYLQIPTDIVSRWGNYPNHLYNTNSSLKIDCLSTDVLKMLANGRNSNYGLLLGTQVNTPKGTKTAYLEYKDSALTQSFKEVEFKYDT